MRTNLNQFDILHWMEGCAIGSHLRQDIWARAIDEFFPKLTEGQRETIYTYAKRDLSRHFESELKQYAADHFNQFLARFNPANQYMVTMEHEDKKEVVNAYKWKGRYFVTSREMCADDYITKVEHLPYRMCGNIMCSAQATCARFEANTERLSFNDKCDLYINKTELEEYVKESNHHNQSGN